EPARPARRRPQPEPGSGWLLSSHTMIRAAWVAPDVPDRNLGGGNQRQAHLLQGLAQRAEVDLYVAGRLVDAEVRKHVNRVIEVVDSAPIVAPLARALAQGGPYDLVCVVHLGLMALRDPSVAPRWVLDLPHLPSRLAEHTSTVMNRRRDLWISRSDFRKARRL